MIKLVRPSAEQVTEAAPNDGLKRLNLGSGQFPKKGYINVDIDPRLNPDVVHNLEEFPFPFQDDTFDEVSLDHNLEHLTAPFQVMAELKRITKPGGTIHIRVPHHSRGFTHADHKRGFDWSFPLYFNPSFSGYMGPHMEHVYTRMHWFAQPKIKKLMLSAPVYWAMWTMGGVFSFFANLSPVICSRIWCYWVGGFEEIEFRFRVPNEVVGATEREVYIR